MEVESAVVGEEKSEQSPPPMPMRVFIVAGLMVLFGFSDRISFKLTVDCVSSYTFFLNQLTMAVYVVGFFVPVLAAGQLCGPWASRRYLLRYFVMAALDALCTLVVILAAPYVPGPLQIIYLQGVIPGTMLFSYFFLRKRYVWSHILGAAVILGAIALSAVHSNQQDAKSGSHVLWHVLFLSFNIPASMSSVYKEYVFRNADVELPLNVVNMWVSVFQFWWTIVYSPVIVPVQGISWHQLPTTFAKGGACLFAHHDGGLQDSCDWYSTAVMLCFFASTLAWNYCCLYLIKNASALLMFVSSTASIPLASLGFAVPLLVRGSCTPKAKVTWEVVVALLGVLAGLALYNKTAETIAPEPDRAKRPNPEERRPLLLNIQDSLTEDAVSQFGHM